MSRYSFDDVRPVPLVAAELSIVLQVSVCRDAFATAAQIGSGPEWGSLLVDIANLRLRHVGATGMRLPEVLQLFVSTRDALQGKHWQGSGWGRLTAAVGDGPHAVVTVHADLDVDLTAAAANAAQISRLRVFFADPAIVRAVGVATSTR